MDGKQSTLRSIQMHPHGPCAFVDMLEEATKFWQLKLALSFEFHDGGPPTSGRGRGVRIGRHRGKLFEQTTNPIF